MLKLRVWLSAFDAEALTPVHRLREYMSATGIRRVVRSEQLLEVLAPYDRIAIVMHDNPDPDAIASGWGIHCLVAERLERPVRLVAGGAIVRAENRHMVDLLAPPVELVDSLDSIQGAGIVLVDCGLGTTNQSLTRSGMKPVAVIDHHQNGRQRLRVPFRDIRPRVAASASLVASYLREQGIEPGIKLATAMLYAIRTEALGALVRYSRLDRSVTLWLTRHADLDLLGEIEQAPLSREYFGDLLLAMQSTFLYDDAALCLLPRAQGPETAGEVADLLIRCQGIRRVLCGAVLDSDLLLSARTAPEAGNATKLLQETINGLGSAGGHDHRAGGKIPGVGRDGGVSDALEDELRTRWLAACDVERQRGTRLVAPREILEHL